MADTNGAITFVVPGLDETQGSATRGAAAAAPSPGLLGGKVVHSVRVFSQRAGGADVEFSATPEQDVVALHLTNGPTLYLHAASARDLFKGQVADSAPRGATAAEAGKVRIPAHLAWSRLDQAGATRGATRGLLGDALLKLVEVIRDPAAKLLAREVVERVDAQVDEGLYQLPPPPPGGPQGTKKKQRRPRPAGRPQGHEENRRGPERGRQESDPRLHPRDLLHHGGDLREALGAASAAGAAALRPLRRPGLCARASHAGREPDRERAHARQRAAEELPCPPRHPLARRPGR